MNLPTRAEDAHATLAAAFNTGDVATVMSMYDVSGIIVPEPNKPVSGRDKFEESIKSDPIH
jgi:ketosteroid isomerase-like protein